MGYLKIPLDAKKQLLVQQYKLAFVNVVEEVNISYEDIADALDSCISGALVSGPQTLSAYDPQVLLSMKQLYYILHPGGVPNDCEIDFASWFNVLMGTNFLYTQLFTHYNNVCGVGTGYICSEPTTERTLYVERDSIIAMQPPLLCGLNEPLATPVYVNDDPCNDLDILALTLAEDQWQLYLDSLRNVFDTAYYNKCMKAKDLESFTVTYANSEYHYTLYYYDQAGNLVKTVPPAGVDNKHANQSFLDNVATKRLNVKNGAAESINLLVPDHKLTTEYRYNTLNQVIAQQTPDAGLSKFYYDRLGRLVVSQNAKQLTENKYSYTLYDALGRITEVGQKPQTTAITQAISSDPGNLENWLQSNGNTTPVHNKEQITITKYDLSYYEGDNTLALGSPPLMLQKNLRNRVSYTMVFDEDLESGSTISHKAATYYSYDIHGNVNELVQDINLPGFAYNMVSGNKVLTGKRFSKMEYDYDLISGKVNQVAYKPGNPDAFYHKYTYDAENRLTDVYTSTDKLLWEKDARYSYFKHGPLARIILGQDQVQGLDYAYTLQGWLKGVNTTSVNDGSIDMGNDGYMNGSTLNQVARDVFGFNLNYFDNDYKAIGGSNPFAQKPATLAGSETALSLYNGNINSMLVNIPKLGEANLYGYKYDQLNRLTSMDLFTDFENANNNWGTSGPALSADYNERVTYDPNGNILTYLRNGKNSVNGTAMDELAYKYDYYDGNVRHTYIPGQTTIPSDARLTNRLNRVSDHAGGTYTEDIKSQNDNNYEYDEIGNLTKDVSEGITNIAWNVYGKIQSITKSSGTITYDYDASGNRISKTANGKTSFYVRDASGNVMGIYEKSNSLNNGDLTLSELHLYGSSRLGIFNRSINVQNTAPNTTGIYTFERGNKIFELSNHLGNILATVSDKKLQHSTNSTTIDYFNADVVTANDYYPFGMLMPGRKYDAGSQYRYGFGGKENDNEVKGEGNQIDYGERVYNPRLGRFLSVDPLTKDYPYYTPYLYAGNIPIRFIDVDGLEPTDPIGWLNWQLSTFFDDDKPNEIRKTINALNPVAVVNNHACRILYNKNFDGTPVLPYENPVTDLGTDVILYLTGEKVFKVILGPKNSVQVLEQQMAKNESLLAGTNPKATTTTPTPTPPKLSPVQVYKAESKISEAIVEDRLKAGLGANEVIVKKPRFYIGNGKKYAVPDFAIYNTETKKFVKIVDAKNGGGELTTAQKQLSELGGRFRGSKRYKDVKAQDVKLKVEKETTNIKL